MTTRGSTRHDEILSVAAALFVRRGFHGTSIDALGAALGISGPALYRHFSSKTAILQELLLTTAAELAESVTTESPAEASADMEELTRFVRRQRQLSLDRHHELTLLDREIVSLDPKIRAEVTSLTEAALDSAIVLVRRFNPVLSEADARTVIRVVWGLLASVSYDSVTNADEVTAVERSALWAIRATPSASDAAGSESTT